ncbi:MAG: histidine kinase [Prevotella sp.]|nr:histidine kinase [Prevotella sp.]
MINRNQHHIQGSENAVWKKVVKDICMLAGLIMLTGWGLASCKKCEHECERSNEDLQRLSSITDSIMELPMERALQMADSLMANCQDITSYYDYYLLKARRLSIGSRPQDAIPYARHVIRFAQSQPDTKKNRGIEAIAYATLSGQYHLRRVEPDSALLYARLAYEKVMASDRMDMAANLTANLADTYVMADNLPQAAHWYRRALFINDSLQMDASRSISLYMGLAQIYTSMRDYPSAEKFYKLTEQHLDELKPNMVTYFLNNYGNLFYFKGEYDRAKEKFLQMRMHVMKHAPGNLYDLELCDINLADVYLNLQRIDSALHYLKPAEKFWKNIGMEQGIYYANTIRIGIAIHENRLDEVEQILNTEQAYEEEIERNIVNIRNGYLDDYYVKRGDYRSAYRHHITIDAYNDSAEYNKVAMRTAEIMSRFSEDTLRLHHQIAIEEKNLALSRSRSQLWLSTTIVLLLLGAGTIHVIHNRKRKLQQSIDMITLKLANARQRISPHFVFNLLNEKLHGANQEERDTLMELVRLIRRNLDLVGEQYVTLDKELDFVARYVRLEQCLVTGGFEFAIQAPPEEQLATVSIPSMFIQLLTENAILHGLKKKQGHKRLTISVTTDQKGTDIRVTDNGPGFDIRHVEGRRVKTGLNVMRQTIALINQKNRTADRMRFAIHNLEKDDGSIAGCEAIIHIPHGIRYFPPIAN